MASTLKVNTIAHSGGTNAMTIDSTGRVLLPQLPVACVSITTSNTQDGTHPYSTTGADMLFDKITVNRGSVYTASNGRFTAPITGLYRLKYTFLRDDSSAANVTYFQVYKNGVAWSEAGGASYSSAGTTNYSVTTNETLVSMNANEYLTVRLIGGEIYLDAIGIYHSVIFELVG
tara:strand:- start:39 stop:560 length:522 start_codon:yes stop_codon:yes gene_type:complete